MRKQKTILIAVLILFISITITSKAQDSVQFNKTRITEIVNSYQPTIVPVINVFSNVVYLDRKIHPENMGGISDNDDVWMTNKITENTWSEPINQGFEYNTNKSDVIFSISPDGKKLLYSENSSGGGGFYLIARNQKKKLNITDYENNSNNYYGYLSPNGRILLLSIEKKSGFGNLDIYVSFYMDSCDCYSKPKNLGSKINTEGTESGMFLAYDSKTLYFTSDKLQGFGKKDIFMTRRLDESWDKWSEPLNLGDKINTVGDESSVCLTSLGDSIIFVSWDSISKRPGIYFSALPEKFRPMGYVLIHGQILFTSENDSNKVGINLTADYEFKKYSDRFETYAYKNEYFIASEPEGYILITARCDGFENSGFGVNTFGLKTPKLIDYLLIMNKKPINCEHLGTILFDYDSDNINDSNLAVLKGIKKQFQIFGNEKIIFEGHTDETGSDDYNIDLSKRRAENTLKIMKEIGLNFSRFEIKAKGKSEPRSKDQTQNRRVEITIIR